MDFFDEEKIVLKCADRCHYKGNFRRKTITAVVKHNNVTSQKEK